MSHRLRLMAKLALLLTLGASVASAQDDPTAGGGNNPGRRGNQGGGGPGGAGGPGGGGGRGNQGGGGPGGFGGGGPGGPGGPGGFGRGNNTATSELLQAPVVQDDLKLNDKQKAAIKDLTEKATKSKTAVREKIAKTFEIQNAAAAAAAAELNAALAAENGIVLGGNGNAGNGQGGNGQGGNGGPGGPGGRGGRGNQAQRQAEGQALQALQVEIEAAYTKVLDTKQKARIKQIALQVQGVGAFQTEELITKLNLDETQVAQIKGITDSSRQTERDATNQMRTAYLATLPNGGEVAADPNAANGANGGGRGGRGGANGGPGGGRPNIDPSVFQSPEFQAVMAKSEEVRKKVGTSTMAAIGKILNKTQRAIYSKMIGDPIDVSKITARNRPGQPGGPGGPPGAQASAVTPAAGVPAAGAAATTPPATTDPAAPAAKPAARKSLRDSRGGP